MISLLNWSYSWFDCFPLIDVDDCTPNPCQNGAYCSDLTNEFTCTCLAGYTGDLCQDGKWSITLTFEPTNEYFFFFFGLLTLLPWLDPGISKQKTFMFNQLLWNASDGDYLEVGDAETSKRSKVKVLSNGKHSKSHPIPCLIILNITDRWYAPIYI